MEGLVKVAVHDEAEIVVTAIVGMMGIIPTIEAIKTGHDIALANKETLIAGGELIMKMASENGVKIINSVFSSLSVLVNLSFILNNVTFFDCRVNLGNISLHYIGFIKRTIKSNLEFL